MPHQEGDVKGGIVRIAGTPYANELQKWEQHPQPWAPTPGNPYQYRPFPKMLYRAGTFKGKLAVTAQAAPRHEFRTDEEWARAEEAATEFFRKNQRVVSDEADYSRAHEAGWRDSLEDALAFAEKREDDISRAAAERHASDMKMSEPAQREASEVDAASEFHVPEVPRKRGGRPKGSKNKPKG